MRRSMMTVSSASFLVISTAFVVAATACSKDPPPPTQPTATAYPTGYPPPNGGYPPPGQTGYPQPTATGYPQPGPTGVAPPAAGTMAVPGPMATPCQNDSPCLLHKCNVQYGKCAFPCQSAADCNTGNNCMSGLCVPGAGH